MTPITIIRQKELGNDMFAVVVDDGQHYQCHIYQRGKRGKEDCLVLIESTGIWSYENKVMAKYKELVQKYLEANNG